MAGKRVQKEGQGIVAVAVKGRAYFLLLILLLACAATTHTSTRSLAVRTIFHDRSH